MKALSVSLAALLLSGCTQIGLRFGVSLANLPARLSDTRVTHDLAYGPDEQHRLDIYRPAEAEGDAPVLVFFYGGRWTDGDKSMYPFVGEAFAGRGYVTVIVDHRKYPQVRFPEFVHDGASALAWVHDHIDRFGGDPDRLFLAGHSSGAHIASLLAADERYLQAQGKPTNIVQAFAGLAGPYDFVPHEDDLIDMFGPPERYPQMQTTTFIDGKEPPMLLLWGEEDSVVWQRNIDQLSQRIRDTSGRVTTRTYKGIDHVGIMASLTWFMRDRRPVFEDMLGFFQQHDVATEAVTKKAAP
ncbi:alpha/beta hydrolase [Marinobacterium sediminicola]|uniref:Acetyl esterase/lipase n=1 Tax=Marinobacterium sediminicola TaxID=518898 RepID=A0ABY1S403_9GAMM|nr:alpha/beta hydrolase [Marinobacterium sediminicola]ULG70153.1 alpha/beta hydrolase [Marinobacterium sediminicola]SMR78377.1 Acetyl esterase/lipase [Marinobacterium sediminicola]